MSRAAGRLPHLLHIDMPLLVRHGSSPALKLSGPPTARHKPREMRLFEPSFAFSRPGSTTITQSHDPRASPSSNLDWLHQRRQLKKLTHRN
jgi:hypothetical protein